jgi:hypothetical protein
LSIFNIQPHKPAEQQVAIQLSHQQTPAAHRIEVLQEQCAQELPREEWRTFRTRYIWP